MTRKNNTNDMTITEQIEVIRAEICDQICKYRETVDDEEELYKLCEHCPLGRL